jgi:hypothetical protein
MAQSTTCTLHYTSSPYLYGMHPKSVAVTLPVKQLKFKHHYARKRRVGKLNAKHLRFENQIRISCRQKPQYTTG